MIKKTFLSLPEEFIQPQNAYFHVLPIPFEGAVSFRPGAVRGPDAILDVSDQMEYIDEKSRRPFWRLGVYTHDPIPPQDSPALQMETIERYVRNNKLYSPERFVIALGGDHSVSGPLIKVAAQTFKDLTVIQFDAHSDLRDQYHPGGKHSHASVMARALESVDHLIQIGVRSFSEEDLIRFPKQVDNFITPDDVFERFEQTVETILMRATTNVYLTFDMDAFDPSVAPGVGTPEPGGLDWRCAVKIIEAIAAEKNIVAADVVETAPLGGNNVVTEFTAARLVAKIMNAVSMKKIFKSIL